MVGSFDRPVHDILTAKWQVGFRQAQRAFVRKALACEGGCVMQPGPGGSSEASNAVLCKDRKYLPIHLIARKNNRREVNAARSGNAAGTIKIGIELSDCLPRLAT